LSSSICMVGALDLFTMVAVAGAILLVIAGMGHVRHLAALRAVLGAQRLLPPRWRSPVATCVAVTELAVGASVLAVQFTTLLPASWSAPALAARMSILAQCVIFAAFTGYLAILRRVRPAAPCGCFAGNDPVGGPAIGRAALISAGTAGALFTPVQSPSPVIFAGAAVVAMLAWLLPALHALRGERPATRPAAPGVKQLTRPH
jgi:hypothetical protein